MDKKVPAWLAVVVASIAGAGSYTLAPESVVEVPGKAPPPVERIVEKVVMQKMPSRQVLVENKSAVYEMAKGDDVLHGQFWGLVGNKTKRIDNATCTFMAKSVCQIIGQDYNETHELEEPIVDKIRDAVSKMFSGKLENVARIECTFSSSNNVCQGFGVLLKTTHTLAPGDKIVGLGK